MEDRTEDISKTGTCNHSTFQVKQLRKILSVKIKIMGALYSQSGRSVSCKFEDYLKIDFHDWMTIRILHCYLLSFM